MIYLDNQIKKTLIYYDIVGKPLTSFETFKYLCNITEKNIYTKNNNQNTKNYFTYKKVKQKLEELVENKTIKSFNGFYYLPIRNKNFVHERIKKDKITTQKFKLLNKKLRIAGYIPFIRGFMLSGSMAFRTASKKSDIDLIVITKPKFIWLTRLFLVIIFFLLRRYRTKKHSSNRFCFNYFLTENNLKVCFKDLSSAQLHFNIFSVWAYKNKHETLNRNFYEANSWIKNYLINYHEPIGNSTNQIEQNKFQLFIQSFFELILKNKFGLCLNKIAKKYQLKRIKNDKRTYWPGARIITNDKELIFHPRPVNKQVLKKMRSYKI